MSRHRNIKHLMGDYYDDDDDDYDDDDYDVPIIQKKNTPKKPPKKAAAKATTTTNKKKIPTTQPAVQKQSQLLSPILKTTTPTAPSSSSWNNASPPPPGLSPQPSSTSITTTTKPLLLPTELLQTTMSADTKDHLTVVILGHVDAGKSTVTGHLLHGPQGSNKPINYAWLLDEDEQERLHGNTMDIGTKALQTTHYNMVLQDAPGHADYVPATITGIANADVALLCVDSMDVTIDKGQLREHVYLAKGLGINQILVILNKFDLVGWDQEALYWEKEHILRAFLQKVGYPANKVRCIPVSGLDGTNLFQKAATDNSNDHPLWKWYNGPTLWEALDTFEAPVQQQKLLEKALRVIVTDVQDSSNNNTVNLRAKCVSGWVQQSEKIVVLPLGDEATIQKLASLHHDRRRYGSAGEVLELTLQNIDAQRITTGSILARPGALPPHSNQCLARIYVLDVTIPLIRGAQVIFHMHQLDVPCNIVKLVRTLESDGSIKKEHPRALTKHTNAIVELQLASRLSMEAFADCRPLGRFVLRRSGDSVAVGRIEQVL